MKNESNVTINKNKFSPIFLSNLRCCDIGVSIVENDNSLCISSFIDSLLSAFFSTTCLYQYSAFLSYSYEHKYIYTHIYEQKNPKYEIIKGVCTINILIQNFFLPLMIYMY